MSMTIWANKKAVNYNLQFVVVTLVSCYWIHPQLVHKAVLVPETVGVMFITVPQSKP
jgi:high-affinity Fe2+/Pb2+ permease